MPLQSLPKSHCLAQGYGPWNRAVQKDLGELAASAQVTQQQITGKESGHLGPSLRDPTDTSILVNIF